MDLMPDHVYMLIDSFIEPTDGLCIPDNYLQHKSIVGCCWYGEQLILG